MKFAPFGALGLALLCSCATSQWQPSNSAQPAGPAQPEGSSGTTTGAAGGETLRPPPFDPLRAPYLRVLDDFGRQHAAEARTNVLKLGTTQRGSVMVVTGYVGTASWKSEVSMALTRAALKAANAIEVLPGSDIGDKDWGIICLSVANGRELPDQKAELGTQMLLGERIRLWKRTSSYWLHWYLVQSSDGYPCWVEEGSFVPMTKEQAEDWEKQPREIVTAFEERLLEKPEPDAQPVSDLVMGDVATELGTTGDWTQLEFADGRIGFAPTKSLELLSEWKRSRLATPEAIERTARLFIGRPYLWGGASPKGLDCSGFCKTVFRLNGINLDRNASQQARQGTEVLLTPGLENLRKGDLLFFGSAARGNRPERVTHAGIYLGNKLFIQSSTRVRLSSLDPASPLRDEWRIRTLLHARRVLGD